MGLVLVVTLLIALYGIYGGNLRFSSGPPQAGALPTADVIRTFTDARGEQQELGFPITVPQHVPGSWHPNSASITDPRVAGLSSIPTVRGGWILPDGSFVTLVESAGTVAQVLVDEVGAAGPQKGTTTAGGANWTVTTGVRTEVAWVRSDTVTTYLITGNAPPDAFTTLAQSIAAPTG